MNKPPGDLSGLTFYELPRAMPGMRRSVLLLLMLFGGCVWIGLGLVLRAVWFWLGGSLPLLAAFALLTVIGGGGFVVGWKMGHRHWQARFLDSLACDDERIAFWKSQATFWQRKAEARHAQLRRAVAQHWPEVLGSGYEGRES